MDVTLPPDLQAYTDELVASGEFSDANAVLEKALRLWMSEREKVLALLQEGIDAADRGDVVDGPEFMAGLLARYPEGETERIPKAA